MSLVWSATFLVFLVMTGYLWIRFSQFVNLIHFEEQRQREEFNRRKHQVLTAIALWQWSVAAMILVGPGSVSAAIPLLGVGLLFLTCSWFSRKFERVLP